MRRIELAYNNVYLVERGGESVLIDTGPDYECAWETLCKGLNGVRPTLVVATHGHSDHAGLGAAWQAVGVPVALGAADLALAAEPGLGEVEAERMTAWVRAAGAPPEVASEAIAGIERRRLNAHLQRAGFPPAGSQPKWPTGLRYRPYQPPRRLEGDQAIAAGLRVLAAPGHTPGNVVVVDNAEGWLFSGDQLLPDLTPTPAIQSGPATNDWRFRSLPAFRDSLLKLAEMNFSRCYPGHGEPFAGVAAAIGANLDAIDQRTAKVAEELRAGGPATLYGLAERLYPRAVKRRFWQIVPTVQGHIDVLDQVGAVHEEGGRYAIQ